MARRLTMAALAVILAFGIMTASQGAVGFMTEKLSPFPDGIGGMDAAATNSQTDDERSPVNVVRRLPSFMTVVYYDPWYRFDPYPRYDYYNPSPFYNPTPPPIMFVNQEKNLMYIWDPRQQRFRSEPVFNMPKARSPVMTVREKIISPTDISRPEEDKADNGKSAYSGQGEYSISGVKFSKAIVGHLVRMNPGKNPKLTVQTAEGEKTFPVSKDAVLLRSGGKARAVEVELEELQIGDRVKAWLNEDGAVTLLRAEYATMSGKVQSLAKDTVLLDTGDVFKITRTTAVILPDHITGKASDIKVGKAVEVRASPVTLEAYLVEIKEASK